MSRVFYCDVDVAHTMMINYCYGLSTSDISLTVRIDGVEETYGAENVGVDNGGFSLNIGSSDWLGGNCVAYSRTGITRNDDVEVIVESNLQSGQQIAFWDMTVECQVEQLKNLQHHQ